MVNASYKLDLITSLPFVYTACRYYRLNSLMRSLNWCCSSGFAAQLILRTINMAYC
ncbi:unnamed protein product [Schistosoma margrebowiei]|uniref:Uncharacterized protein n=1 Tax=Schistosoma margrebowiei TaxID=48269 RepID=A0A3P8CJ04_9TREM|nr:unnamed protein product [Schistosoma margrebowiei]